MFLLNSNPIHLDAALVIDGYQYPAGYFRSRPDARAAVGITEVADQPRPDERYNYVHQNQDLTYTAIPKLAKDFKAQKLAEINAAFTAELDQYAAGYPRYEQLTWSDQKAESAAWVAWEAAGRPEGQEPPTPRLDGIAARRMIDREELIRRANAKAVLFAQVSDDAIGKRQRLEDQILAIPDDTPAEEAGFDNIKW